MEDDIRPIKSSGFFGKLRKRCKKLQGRKKKIKVRPQEVHEDCSSLISPLLMTDHNLPKQTHDRNGQNTQQNPDEENMSSGSLTHKSSWDNTMQIIELAHRPSHIFFFNIFMCI